MNFYLENKNYDLPQVFIKFLIILSPIVGIFLIFFIFKSIYYMCLRFRVRMKKLDINLLRWHFNLFLESNKVFYLLKDVNTHDEVEQMIKKGALKEVKNFLKLDLKTDSNIFKIIGIREIKDFIHEKTSLDDLKQNIVIKTRQYAKRQRTWSRGKMSDWQKFDAQAVSKFINKL